MLLLGIGLGLGLDQIRGLGYRLVVQGQLEDGLKKSRDS